MEVFVRKFDKKDIRDAILIWNQVVEDGVAFPQTELLDESSGMRFFEEQTFTGIACEAGSDKIVGLYILHPNNVGRCGHICNASYAVKRDVRG
ncbi:MAG TPA: GNAT family N-acetyltransferase, partial [Candidatus Blautia excrementigallinarum]|nr:GNAT family N-acetyltransferase [Candidatus Blautia excrementigallinarum]